jgi:hypothetical protein
VHAHHGDRLVVEGTRVGSPRREGEVLEAHGPDGGPPFLVRWSDGVQCLVYPGTDAHIEPAAPAEPADG